LIQRRGIDFFRKINNAYQSSSKKETTLYEIRESIARTHKETIDYQPDTLVDGQPMPLIVMENRGGGLDKEKWKKLEAPPDSVFYLGSKVDCFGLKWLVTEINYNQEVKLAGKMQLCNYVLKWQNKNGDVLHEECVISRYRTSATGEDPDKVITLNDTRRSVLVQFNNQTATLKQGMRFFIDIEGLGNEKVYKLTDLNRSTGIYDGRGFFELIFDEVQVNMETDRPDLMLADYTEPPDSPLPSIGHCEILFDGKPQLRAGGSAKEFTAVFFDIYGAVIDTIVPAWETVLPSALTSEQIDVSYESDRAVSLRALSGVGENFILRVSVDDAYYGFFEASVRLHILPLW